MKTKLISGIVVAVTLAMVLALAPNHQASAATVAQGPPAASVGTGWTNLNPALGTVKHQVNVANKAFAAAHPTTPGAASVQIGWGTALLTLSHADVGNSLWKGYFLGEAAVLVYACGFLPGWISTGACIFGMAVLWNQIISALDGAYGHWSWYVPIGQCGTWGGYWDGTWTPCNLPGAHLVPDFFGRLYWIAEHQVSGLNLLFSWAGVPLAWQINDFSG